MNLIISAVFLLHSLLPHSTVAGLVLCIGDDGHIAVERIADDQTHSIPDDNIVHSVLNTSAPHHHDHHDNCIDIPITNPSARNTHVLKRYSPRMETYFTSYLFSNHFNLSPKATETNTHQSRRPLGCTLAAFVSPILLI